jgi:hypothetical protein
MEIVILTTYNLELTTLMSYNLFLDDLRTVDMVYPGQSDNFVVVRSYAAFVKNVEENGLPAFISFDNDLGEDDDGIVLPDGYECAKWLVYESELDLRNLKFKVHSANPIAKVQIQSLLTNYIRFLKE